MKVRLEFDITVNEDGVKLYKAQLDQGETQAAAAARNLVSVVMPAGMVETVQIREALLRQPGVLNSVLEEAGLVKPKQAAADKHTPAGALVADSKLPPRTPSTDEKDIAKP